MKLLTLKQADLQKAVLVPLVLAAFFVATGCTKKETTTETDVVHAPAAPQAQSSDTTTTHVVVKADMDAETLALAGEQLVSPYTFMLADKVFDMALAQDPTNTRALVLKSFIKPYMALKGIWNRVYPMAIARGQKAKQDDTIAKTPDSPLKTFLLDGPQDISNEAGLQVVMDDIKNGFDDFRRFLKKNPDLDIVLNLNPYTFKDRIEGNLLNSCVTQQATDGELVVDCRTAKILQVELNSADLTVLGQQAAGMVLYFTVLNAYSADGYADWVDYSVKHPTAPEMVRNNFLSANAKFGKLRDANTLKLVAELGADFSAAAKWVINSQTEICSQGRNDPRNRPGFYLDLGICIPNIPESQRNLAVLDQLLKGAVTMTLPDKDGNNVDTQYDIFALTRSPVADLRSYMPSAYDQCGIGIQLADKTLNGVFPSGDAEKFVLSKSTGVCNTLSPLRYSQN
jgi:hypothetical protein